MRPERLAVLLAAVAVAAAIAAGIWSVGGPRQGAAERRDEARYRDLLELRQQVYCLTDAAGGALPETLGETDACHIARRYEDPYTGAAYRYERLSDTAFRLCAGFEAPDVTRFSNQNFDAETGCLNFSRDHRG
jgi:hypothetical protein